MSFEEDRKGVAGFFEDIPALMVVTIGLAVFLFSLASGLSGYLHHHEALKEHGEGVDLVQALRSYQGLIYEDLEGVLDGEKVSTITFEELILDLDPRHLGYDYTIQITDLSGKGNAGNYTRTFNTSLPGPGSEVTVLSSPVVIQVDGQARPGMVTIKIWRDA